MMFQSLSRGPLMMKKPTDCVMPWAKVLPSSDIMYIAYTLHHFMLLCLRNFKQLIPAAYYLLSCVQFLSFRKFSVIFLILTTFTCQVIDAKPAVLQTKNSLDKDSAKTGLQFVKHPDDTVALPKRDIQNEVENSDSALRFKPVNEKTEPKKEKLVLGTSDLQPPDHLDAVKLERDGHLNRDYVKEVFLGDHEAFEKGTEEEVAKKLEDIVHRVDGDKDGLISQSELEDWIIQKVEEHFDETLEENDKIFEALDPDNDGFITWREFYIQFLMAKGHTLKEAEKHTEDYEYIHMDPSDKDMLIKNKFKWSEADQDPQDNKLTKEEFKNFRHPEQSKPMIEHMAKEILSNLDQDRDGVLSEYEFVAVPPGEVVALDSDWMTQEKEWQEERRKEFREVIDLDRNGHVTRDELKNYVDPRNPNHAKEEAKNLIHLADSNKDLHLSLKEVLDNKDLFLGSKMCNAGKNFHDEF